MVDIPLIYTLTWAPAAAYEPETHGVSGDRPTPPKGQSRLRTSFMFLTEEDSMLQHLV